MKDIKKTEELLESLSPKPLPSKLKEKIITNAYHKNRELRVLSPAYRILLGISCILLFMVLLSEFLIQKSQRHHLASIIDRPQTSEAASEDDLQKMTADLLNIQYDSSFNQWLTRYYKVHRKPVKLKNFQDFMEILKEEINGI